MRDIYNDKRTPEAQLNTQYLRPGVWELHGQIPAAKQSGSHKDSTFNLKDDAEFKTTSNFSVRLLTGNIPLPACCLLPELYSPRPGSHKTGK